MNLLNRARQFMHDPLSTFKFFERTVAAICISIPLVLWLADVWPGCCLPCQPREPGFRSSISDYAYMWHSYYFGMMLTMAAMLFMVNGVVYFRSQERFELNKHGKWYNVILGVALLGVVLFPYKQHPYPHYSFAIVFFAGNAIVPVFYGSKGNRAVLIGLALLTLVSFAIHLIRPKQVSLSWAEWISLAVIGVHFILEARDVGAAARRPAAQKQQAG